MSKLAALVARYSIALAVAALAAVSEAQVIEPRFIHLRNDAAREWSSFPEKPEGTHLEVRFDATKNEDEATLRLRQQDVKQAWNVKLNGKPLGNLVRDEADLVIHLPIAAGMLADGENVLRIESPAGGAKKNADDIRVGQLGVDYRTARDVKNESTLEIEVLDAESKRPLPARLTIADSNGSLIETAAVSGDHLAVRPGVVYTSTGKARFGLPAGKCTVYAGRGFEYSLAKIEIDLGAGQSARHVLTIRREVPTQGYVACDTHIHTLTHSGHGDATLDERLITLAGEGLELPIATDHNIHIDYEPHARRLGVRQYFTPVIGNEVTTNVGHFNVLPARADARVPDFKLKEWPRIFDEIFGTPGVRVVILNHARDLHGGTRPFGPLLFNAAIGENTDNRPMRFTAMEVVNSGATQTDVMRLFRDWMALLNRGYQIAPVGSSDSHDVTRYIVGQGRTYVRCDDRNVAELDTAAAVESFLSGGVMVSYGLLAELTVSDKYKSGDLAALAGDEVQVEARVLGPHWVNASRVQLYANGELLRDEAVSGQQSRELPLGVKWQGGWKLPRPRHDVHLVAIALGPGIDGPYWPTAKPYQPTSPDWTPQVVGCSGAVWLDADGDGRRMSARDYAERIHAAEKRDLPKLVAKLGSYDAAVSAQAAHLYRLSGGTFESEELANALESAPPAVSTGFRAYFAAHRECERAKAER